MTGFEACDCPDCGHECDTPGCIEGERCGPLAILAEIGGDPKKLVAYLAGVSVEEIDELGGMPDGGAR